MLHSLPSNPVRWGFIGAGRIATVALAPAVRASPNAVLQAVAARSQHRAAALKPLGRAYGGGVVAGAPAGTTPAEDAAGSRAYAELLADESVEAVYISLHNGAHHPWTLAALAAGKHVLCEKPLGGTATEVSELIAAATAADRLLVEATWYRWHPRTHRALALLAELGPAQQVQADFCFGDVPADDFRMDPAHGGGALADVGCYAVSAAAIFLHASSLAVDSAQLDVGPTGVDLAASATVRGGTGQAHIRCGIAELERQGVVVTCPGGTLELVAPPFTTWHQPAELRIQTPAGDRVETFPEYDPYQLMIQAMSRRIRDIPLRKSSQANSSAADPGDPVHGSWLLPWSESLLVAQTLDAIRAWRPPVPG